MWSFSTPDVWNGVVTHTTDNDFRILKTGNARSIVRLSDVYQTPTRHLSNVYQTLMPYLSSLL